MVVSNGRRAAYDQQSIPGKFQEKSFEFGCLQVAQNRHKKKRVLAALVSGGIHSLDWVTVLSMSINVFCALMNLIRGMAIISHGHFDVSSWQSVFQQPRC